MEQYGDQTVISQLRDWIRLQTRNEYQLTEVSEDKFILDTPKAKGEIIFYPMGLMELMITEKNSDKNIYYMHFEMNDFDHGKELINDMISELITFQNADSTTKILLCCSGGLTTGFFAKKLNDTAKTLGIPYEFSAVSYMNVYEQGFIYDGVFLAPQIAYEFDKISAVLSDKVVRMIPNTIFAKFDPGKMLDFVRTEIESAKKKEPTKSEKLEKSFHNNRKILVVALINSADKCELIYRYYKNGDIIENAKIIKKVNSIRDIEDIIDTMEVIHPEIEEIVLAIPGTVAEDDYYYPLFTKEHKDVKGYLENKYKLPITLINDMNATVYGIYSLQNQYENIVYYFQPHGFATGSAGIIINGQVVHGLNGIAGEMFFMTDLYKLEDKPENMIKTPEGMMEFMAPNLKAIIAIIGPEALMIHTDMIPSEEDVLNVLHKTFRDINIPDIKIVREINEFMLTGAMLWGVNNE